MSPNELPKLSLLAYSDGEVQLAVAVAIGEITGEMPGRSVAER